MIIREGFEYWLKMRGKELSSYLAHCVGSQRFLWNEVLALQLARLKRGRRIASYYATAALLVKWKKRKYPFLADVPSQSLQQTLKSLFQAFMDAFDKTQPNKKLPVFKRKFKSTESFRIPQYVEISNNAVKLPKIGWVAFKSTRKILGEIKNTTVKREGKRWKVVFQTERSIEDPVHPYPKSVFAADLGCEFLAGTTAGDLIEGPKAFKSCREQLAKYQRELATKVKGSLRYLRLKRLIGALHRRIAAIRKDFLHKLSTRWAKSHSLVVLEDLAVMNMTASAKGTVDEPGTNVAQKSGLNRSILDQGWGELARQLGYKLTWLGGTLLKVPAHHTSQECPELLGGCGHIAAANRVTRGQFCCEKCGLSGHADLIAPWNILRRGLRLRGA